jgi:hypothetical protein
VPHVRSRLNLRTGTGDRFFLDLQWYGSILLHFHERGLQLGKPGSKQFLLLTYLAHPVADFIVSLLTAFHDMNAAKIANGVITHIQMIASGLV